MSPEIYEALELAAGIRLKSGITERTTVSPYDTAATRRAILLFLESLDSELTVAELREELDA